MSGLNQIWNNEKGILSEEKLMAYLQGKLNAKEQHEIEQLLNQEGFESDAMDGLQALPAESTAYSVRKLNKQLQHLTHKRKRRTQTLSENKWVWVTVLLVLLLSILGYWVLHIASH